jgi:hypothetical protein
MSEGRNEGKDANQLIARVDALMKRQHEDLQRATEEVPLLTEIVAHDATAVPAAGPKADKALASDIERVLLVRLIPELNKQIAGLRSELEKEMRRSVRDAVEHALASRKEITDKTGGRG